MDEKVKTDEPKVLLTQSEDGKLKAIAGEQDGKIRTVDPTKENADQFMKIDTKGNALGNSLRSFRHSSATHHTQHRRLRCLCIRRR